MPAAPWLVGDRLPIMPARRNEPRIAVLSWDYKEQPPLDELAKLIEEFSEGRLHLRCVEDTGSDEYAVVVSHLPMSEQGVAEAYRRDCRARGQCA